MGTRNLTCVVKNGEYKVAQYGQWDGYLSGQGTTVLKFLRTTNMKEFNKNIDKVKFMNSVEINELDKTNWKETHPYLSRDYAAKILNVIMSNGGEVELIDESEFGKDSLMCEYAYVINLDTMKLEVYSGFNQSKNNQSTRFYVEDPDGNYYGSSLLVEFDTNELPTDKEFLAYDEEDE